MFQKGHTKLGGRKAGIRLAKLTVRDILGPRGAELVDITARIAENDIECSVCRGKLRTVYRLPEGQHSAKCKGNAKCTCEGLGTRACESCNGTGKEPVKPADRLKGALGLLPFLYPTLRQVEHTGTALENRPAVQIMFVEAPKPVPSVNIHSLESPAAAPGDKKVFSPVNKTIIPTFTK